MQTPEDFMREAIRLAAENVEHNLGGPFGAVVVKDQTIIARGQNRVTAQLDPTAHAEVQAIRAACNALSSFQLDDCELYTSCEPCPMCLGAIYWARPRRVYFACTHEDAANIDFDDAFIYTEIAKLPHDREIPFGSLLRQEGLRAFELWRDSEHKKPY